MNGCRPTLVNVNSDETLFNLHTVSRNKCVENCSTIDDPYAEVCVPKT